MAWKRIEFLKGNVRTRYRNTNGEEIGCYKCGDDLPRGCSCWSHTNSHSENHAKYYCDPCYDKLWL